MPRQTEHSDASNPLPTPDLNPLVNPVLGQHMGRWAEVYFTSPPEKREQAVLDLLRELEASNSAREEDITPPPLTAEEQVPEPPLPIRPIFEGVRPTMTRCSCGRENPPSQKFCGMCGVRLNRGDSAPQTPVEPGPDRETTDFGHGSESQAGRREFRVHEPRFAASELSLFQRGNSVDYDEDSYEDYDSPPSRPYRVYVGIALALVICALLYMAWRSAQLTSQDSHVGLPAAPVASKEAPASKANTPATSAATTPAPTTSTPASNAAASAPEPSVAPSKSAVPDRTASTENQPAPPSTAAAKPIRRERAEARPRATPASEKRTVDSPADTGSQELAMAQGYLAGANGRTRNSAEAAKWLWKAMAKHNADAMLALSDLYLKGDGVPKNCDQAHVLLDAAALRGVKEAGARLRHLQAFGCQ